MTEDSDVLYDMMRFTPDGSMAFYTCITPEHLDTDGELCGVCLEYIPYTVNFTLDPEAQNGLMQHAVLQ